MSHEKLLLDFYTAFNEKNATDMVSCYHKNIVFEDPIFGKLKGDKARKMWHWICYKGEDLKVTHSDITIDEDKGFAKCEVRYTYGERKRPILNRISAEFEFKDGKIIRHEDTFDLKTWATQAIGWKGKVIGGTSYFKKKLQFRSRKLIQNFEIVHTD